MNWPNSPFISLQYLLNRFTSRVLWGQDKLKPTVPLQEEYYLNALMAQSETRVLTKVMEFLFPVSAQHRIVSAPLVLSEEERTVFWMECPEHTWALSDILGEFQILQAVQFLDLPVQAKEAFRAVAYWRKEGTALLSCHQETRALLRENCEPPALCRGGWGATAQPGTLNPGLDCTESQAARWKD